MSACLDGVDERSAEARTAVAGYADRGEQRLGVARRKILCPLFALRMELDRSRSPGHADNEIIITSRTRLPKVLPKKRNETRGDNSQKVVRKALVTQCR